MDVQFLGGDQKDVIDKSSVLSKKIVFRAFIYLDVSTVFVLLNKY